MCHIRAARPRTKDALLRPFRTIARLMTTGRDTLSKSETMTIAAIEDGVPPLIEARAVIAAFHTMIRKKAEAELERVDRMGAIQSRQILRQRRREGQGRYSCRHRFCLVQWSDRRADHKTQAREAANVWARQNRFARSAPHRRILIDRCTKIASEPNLRANFNCLTMQSLAMSSKSR